MTEQPTERKTYDYKGEHFITTIYNTPRPLSLPNGTEMGTFDVITQQLIDKNKVQALLDFVRSEWERIEKQKTQAQKALDNLNKTPFLIPTEAIASIKEAVEGLKKGAKKSRKLIGEKFDIIAQNIQKAEQKAKLEYEIQQCQKVLKEIMEDRDGILDAAIKAGVKLK